MCQVRRALPLDRTGHPGWTPHKSHHLSWFVRRSSNGICFQELTDKVYPGIDSLVVWQVETAMLSWSWCVPDQAYTRLPHAASHESSVLVATVWLLLSYSTWSSWVGSHTFAEVPSSRWRACASSSWYSAIWTQATDSCGFTCHFGSQGCTQRPWDPVKRSNLGLVF